ncbi:MAG: tetratricopeptide repeat protein [Bacteroidota bacterium]
MKERISCLGFCILFIITIVFYSGEVVAAQITKIDSLILVLKNVKEDTSQVNTLNELSREYINKSNYELAHKYVDQAQKLAQKLNFRKGMAYSFSNMGLLNLFQGNYEKAMDNNLNALKIREELGDKNGASKLYNNIGIIYRKKGDIENALLNYSKALKMCEDVGDKKGIGMALNNIGLINAGKGNYEESLENYLKSLKISEEINDKRGVSLAYQNIGNVYQDQKDFTKAMQCYIKALKIQEEIGDKRLVGITQNNIGVNCIKSENLDEAYLYLSKSINVFNEIGFKDGIRQSYLSLSELYEKKHDYKQAFEYHKLYSDIKDTLLNEQSNKQIAEMSTKYESEKKEHDIELLTKDKNLQQAEIGKQQAEIGKQKLIRNGTIGGLVLALLLAFVLFNRFKVTSKQKKIIESQNFQIVESINYSKKIQDSLLPSLAIMQKAITGLFVFYEPKAIVSGDFYFFKEFEKHTLLACVDCTGHGVPGGFMSTLGSLLLDKIADNEELSPSEILNKLSNEIIRILHQHNGGEIQDGMDLSICLIDRVNKRVEFSGARNGIIVVSNNEAKRYKADALPVGGNYMKKGISIERYFKTQSISINASDWIYMYTDGFMEQIGGTEGIPMNYNQFEKHLISLSKKHTSEEKCEFLKTELDNWRGTHERDDDVLVIGFQIV